MRRPKPQIIVEEPEDEESEEEECCNYTDSDASMCNLNVANFGNRMMNYYDMPRGSDSAESGVFMCPSPTPSIVSTSSRHDFSVARIDDFTFKGMIQIGTLSERSKITKLRKYVNKATMAQYAVAEWDLSTLTDQQIEELCNELEVSCNYRHKRLASIYGYYTKEKQVYIFRSCLPSGSISDRLKRGPLPEAHAMKYVGQMIDALTFLHERKKIHGNITASNLLVTISNDIQLSDMLIKGLPSPALHRRRYLLSAPPEAFADINSFPQLTPEADIWAVGCALVTMVTRYPPFSDHFLSHSVERLHRELVMNWKKGRLCYTAEMLTPTASSELMDLVNCFFVVDPEQRPTAQQLLDTMQTSKCTSRKTSVRTSLASIRRMASEKGNTNKDSCPHGDNRIIEEIEFLQRERAKSELDKGETFGTYLRWYLSRILIFSILLFKWIGMVLCAALSLALVAGSVFLSIFIIYNGIQVVCQCELNEGFVVLIALILLPIIILLTTLCCNNSLEKYHQDVEIGKVEKSRYVRRTPEEDVVLCGIIVVDGKPREKTENKRKVGVDEDADRESPKTKTESALGQMVGRSAFLSGVARIA